MVNTIPSGESSLQRPFWAPPWSFLNGGRGLTGRAGGGEVGCGGGFYEETTTEDRGAGGFRVERAEKLPVEALVPELRPGQRSLSYTVKKTSGPVTSGPPNPTVVPRRNVGGDRADESRRYPEAAASTTDAILDSGADRFHALVERLGLAAVLDTPYRQFTVFAPTNEAVERLAQAEPKLFDPQNEVLLQDLLAHHILARELRVFELTPGQLESLTPGGFIIFEESGGELLLSAGVSAPAQLDRSSEVIASNGVVHQVDEVYCFPNYSVWSRIRNSGHTSFVEAVQAAQMVDRFTELSSELTVLVPTNAAFRLAGWPASRLHDPGERSRVVSDSGRPCHRGPRVDQQVAVGVHSGE